MIKEIRIESNWYKKCYLISEYHRSMTNGTKRPHKWKISDTAKALGYSTGYVSESIRIIELISVNDCKNRNEALKRIR